MLLKTEQQVEELSHLQRVGALPKHCAQTNLPSAAPLLISVNVGYVEYAAVEYSRMYHGTE